MKKCIAKRRGIFFSFLLLRRGLFSPWWWIRACSGWESLSLSRLTCRSVDRTQSSSVFRPSGRVVLFHFCRIDHGWNERLSISNRSPVDRKTRTLRKRWLARARVRRRSSQESAGVESRPPAHAVLFHAPSSARRRFFLFFLSPLIFDVNVFIFYYFVVTGSILPPSPPLPPTYYNCHYHLPPVIKSEIPPDCGWNV